MVTRKGVDMTTNQPYLRSYLAPLENSFLQTTLLACQLDGGTPVILPDLPRPVPHKTAWV